jgi:RNA polymerase sigma factor (sigma-70 family)
MSINSYSNSDDSQLIDACLAGDEKAWEALIQRYSALIYTIPLRFGFSKGIADEIFQETCLILLEKLQSISRRERLSAWLVTVCRRACIQRWHQSKRLDPLGDQDSDHQTEFHEFFEEELLLIEQHLLLHQAIEKLEPRCQQIIKARYFETPPRSYNQIALELDVPLGSIGPVRLRCLEKLKNEILALEQLSFPPK